MKYSQILGTDTTGQTRHAVANQPSATATATGKTREIPRSPQPKVGSPVVSASATTLKRVRSSACRGRR
jgi:hypothetical protein